MRRILSFSEMLRTYRLKGRSLLALLEKGDDITLRFDLYHCDDPDRCESGIEYLLDVSVYREQFRIVDGAGERLHEKFSADILAAEISGNEFRLIADCTFYVSKDHDVVTIALTGGKAALKEYPPKKWAEARNTSC